MDLNKRLYDLATAAKERQNENLRSLLGATGEMLGGLAQALGSPDWEPPSGLALVELKRALRGAAFVFGMLFRIHHENRHPIPSSAKWVPHIHGLMRPGIKELISIDLIHASRETDELMADLIAQRLNETLAQFVRGSRETLRETVAVQTPTELRENARQAGETTQAASRPRTFAVWFLLVFMLWPSNAEPNH